MNTDVIYSILEIAFILIAVVLVFIGLRTSIKVLDKDTKDKQIPQEVFIKSTKIIVVGIIFYGLARYSSNSLSAEGEGYGMIDIMIQSLWEAVYTIGFVALIPYVIYRFTSPKHKRTED
jgi:hypothetical protein